MTPWLHAVLDLPAGAEDAEAFWAEALGWPLGEPWPGHPELASFAPPRGDAYVHRQRVQGGPGVHLDLEVPDVDAEDERLVGLGATRVRRTAEWRTLRSPGGLPFCLVAARPRVRPDPVTGPSGRRRRLVQVCLDVPARHLAVEPAFWRAALPWPVVAQESPEFLGRLVPPPGATLQVLLQALGEDDGGDVTRAHLDLGADDVAAEADRLIGLGAQLLRDRGGFIALRDPAGSGFCVTANSPDAP